MKSLDIINLEKKQFTKKEVTLTSGDKTFVINVEKKFKKTEIVSLIKEFAEISNYCIAQNIEIDSLQAIYVLLIKHFTDIKFSTFKDLEKQFAHDLDMLSALINLGLLPQIIESFDEAEIKKTEDMITDYKLALIKKTEQLKEMQKIKDKEVEENGKISI